MDHPHPEHNNIITILDPQQQQQNITGMSLIFNYEAPGNMNRHQEEG